MLFYDLYITIAYGIFTAFWYLMVVLPLILMKAILICYNLIAIALPQYILFGIGINDSFELSRFPTMFLRLLIISIFMYFIFFVASLVRLYFWKGDNEPNPVGVAIKYSVLATVWILGIPLVLYIFNIFIGIMLHLILGDGKDSLDYQIFMALYDSKRLDGITVRDWQNFYENNYLITKDKFAGLGHGQGVQVIFLGCLLSVSTLIPLALGLLVVVQKVFQQFFLFIISPFVAATAVADDGKRLKQWCQMYFAKGFAMVSLVVGVQILSVFLKQSFNWVRSLETQGVNFFIRFLLMFGVAVGGAVASMNISSEVASFVGESASIRETLGETKGLIASGAALAGGVKAAFKGGSKLAKAGVKGATAVAKGRRGLQALAAKRDLKSKFKSGKLSREEYQVARQGLNDKIAERREAVRAAKKEDREENKVLREQIDKGDSALKKRDLSKNTNQLTRTEKSLQKKEEKLRSKEKRNKGLGEKDSKKLENITKRRNEISQRLDRKIDRYAKDSLEISPEIKRSYEHARRGKVSDLNIDGQEKDVKGAEITHEREKSDESKKELEKAKDILETSDKRNRDSRISKDNTKDFYDGIKKAGRK